MQEPVPVVIMCSCAGSLMSSWNPLLFAVIISLVLSGLVIIFGIELYFIWRRCNERQKRMNRREENRNGADGDSPSGN